MYFYVCCSLCYSFIATELSKPNHLLLIWQFLLYNKLIPVTTKIMMKFFSVLRVLVTKVMAQWVTNLTNQKWGSEFIFHLYITSKFIIICHILPVPRDPITYNFLLSSCTPSHVYTPSQIHIHMRTPINNNSFNNK